MTEIDLQRLAQLLPDARQAGAPPHGVTVSGASYDSRRVSPGDLFFCVPGARHDGHQFLPDAVAAGASAAVVSRTLGGDIPIPLIVTEDVRAAMGLLSAEIYGHPTRRLTLVGVTGTNGKTTTTYLIEGIARHAGRPTGVVGTVSTRINDVALPSEMTTPEAPDLQHLFDRMARTFGNDKAVVSMEVSSHALDQNRTGGCEFDVVVFTNLTQDHLDYHSDMESYYRSKRLLFTRSVRETDKSVTAVINIDDEYGRRLAAETETSVLTFGLREGAAVQARDPRATAAGIAFRLVTSEGECDCSLPLGGLFNVSNALAAAAAARAMGLEWREIREALAEAGPVPGRFERIRFESGKRPDFDVIVDYAHTPDGLQNVLAGARALKPARLITVFGCGGDRDRAKRPLMAGIAAQHSDLVIVTSDNPRTEEPEAIIEEIMSGMPAAAASQVQCITDRREAIRTAIKQAQRGDLVVIAGKGHEDYQIIGSEKRHFDDREEARAAIHDRQSA